MNLYHPLLRRSVTFAYWLVTRWPVQLALVVASVLFLMGGHPLAAFVYLMIALWSVLGLLEALWRGYELGYQNRRDRE